MPITQGNPRWNNLGYWNYDVTQLLPEKTAIIDLSQAEPREIRYRELEERLNRVARMLTDHGLKSGDRIAMSISNRFEFVEIFFGAMRAGIVPVPLNTKLGADTLEYIVRDAECVGAIVEEAANCHVAKLVEALALKFKWVLGSNRSGWFPYENTLLATNPIFNPIRLTDDHPSFQPYTSGSTGLPKGVVLTHTGQCWWIGCLKKYWPNSPDNRSLAAVPLYHKNAMAGAIKPMLATGGSVVLLPNFEPRRFLTTLSKYHCTHAGAVPAVFTLLLQERDLIQSLDFSALRSLKIGSAPTPKELLDAVETAFGIAASESYGLTEGGPVMIGSPTDGRSVPHGSCGVVWPEGEVKLVGADGNEDPSYGELWVRNPGVTPGYWKLPDVNAKRIQNGWLRTGDIFSRDDQGFYYFRGRTDDMFNSGGENIYPLEVENLLLRNPAVAEASVVPVPHRIKGEVPVAMVVKAKGRDITEEDLRQFTLSNGPAYAHPRRIVFVNQLPLNGPGKIDRKAVQKLMSEHFGTLG